MDKYTLIRTFTSKEDVEYLIDILKDNSIDFKIQSIDLNLIPYLQQSLNNKFGLFIYQNHLSLLEEVIEKNIKEFSIKEHPLQEMTNDELIEILKKQDEWSIEEILISKRILSARGVQIAESDIADYNNQRIIELKQPIKGNVIYLIGGFLCPIIGILSATMIGFIGFFIYLFSYGIGINFLLDFKRLPNNEKIKVYDKNTRLIGLFIILWAGLSTIGTILLLERFYK